MQVAWFAVLLHRYNYTDCEQLANYLADLYWILVANAITQWIIVIFHLFHMQHAQMLLLVNSPVTCLRLTQPRTCAICLMSSCRGQTAILKTEQVVAWVLGSVIFKLLGGSIRWWPQWPDMLFCSIWLIDISCYLLQVDSYWLPLVRQVVPDDYRKPIILVGNKSDVLESSSMDVWLVL